MIGHDRKIIAFWLAGLHRSNARFLLICGRAYLQVSGREKWKAAYVI
jgi:hypothetical protein